MVELGRGSSRVAITIDKDLIEKRSKAIFDYYKNGFLNPFSADFFAEQTEREIRAYTDIRRIYPEIEGVIIPVLHNTTRNLFSLEIFQEIDEFEMEALKHFNSTIIEDDGFYVVEGEETILVLERVTPFEDCDSKILDAFFEETGEYEEFKTFAKVVCDFYKKDFEEIEKMINSLNSIFNLDNDCLENSSNWGINKKGFPVILDLGL